jgi:carboxypeptidase family protein
MLDVLLVACALFPLSFATQTIEGRVLNAATAEGIPAVTVRIFPADSSPAAGYSTTTDSEGRFRIEGVAEGAYRAVYAASGFIPVPGPGEMPQPFPVAAAGDPIRLEVKMNPLAKISGRVLDASGKPVPDAGIWLIAEEKWCMPPECRPDHRQSKSGAKGEFGFTDLRPGPWLVAATAPPSWDPPPSRGDERLGWVQTFFPGVTDPRLAQAIVLPPGGEQWSVDIKLAAAPTHFIRGRVLDPHGDPVPNLPVTLSKSFGPPLTQATHRDGTFEFGAVTADQWFLSAAINQGGVKLKSCQTVAVKDRDLEDFELRLGAPFSLQGKIVVEVPEGAPVPQPPEIDMGLVPVEAILSDGPEGFLPLGSDGANLTARDVYPGSYRVQFLADAAVPYFLDSIRLGEQDAAGSFAVASAALPLTITYKLGGGTVRGTVEACASHHIFLVPEDRSLRRDGFIRIGVCDPNSRFEFAAVRPGEYYAIAMANEPRSFASLSDDRVLRQAGKVTVRLNETTSVDIRLSVP